MSRHQRLLISVRGPVEAIAAAKGDAHIADVEYPASALGTPYPLNIAAVRKRLNTNGFRGTLVSTNIGEVPNERANACQAALGVATAGADLIKFGLAELPLEAAAYLGKQIVRTVREWHLKKNLYPAVFVDDDMQRFFKVFRDSVPLAQQINADGVLIDTFNKSIGKGLLDYCTLSDIKAWVQRMHKIKKEAWIAGSITKDELPDLWATGVNVICVRGAACKQVKISGRFGTVDRQIVAELVQTIPKR
ncbi:MAG: hypothetical protein IT445_15015 [Phycisphaeraceae bacterium]|nr:hypothetical protein [Phycisphaeraceae bacterium]